MRPAAVVAVRPFRTLIVISVVLAGTLAAPSLSWGATRSVSPSGVDAGACLTSACRSFSYAYRQSAPGDVVEAAAGSYGGQSIPKVAGRAAPAVEFRPRPGASVTLGDLDIAGGFVTVRDIWTGSVAIDAGDSGVTPVEGVSIINGGGPTMWIQTARNLLVKGGSYGGNTEWADGADRRDAGVDEPDLRWGRVP